MIVCTCVCTTFLHSDVDDVMHKFILFSQISREEIPAKAGGGGYLLLHANVFRQCVQNLNILRLNAQSGYTVI